MFVALSYVYSTGFMTNAQLRADSRTLSFRVRKRHCVLHAMACLMVSATRTASSTSTLRRGYSTWVPHTASCTYPAGPHPILAPTSCIVGHPTFPSSSAGQSVSLPPSFFSSLVYRNTFIVPPFRGEDRSAPRNAFLHFRS